MLRLLADPIEFKILRLLADPIEFKIFILLLLFYFGLIILCIRDFTASYFIFL